MSDLDMVADEVAGRFLWPANENPWYVLMTLYGEQEEYYFENQELNRRAWNAWACQAMSEEERVRAAKAAGVTVEELSAWPLLKGEIEKLHKDEFQKRNENIPYPGIVYNGMEGKFVALLSNLHFTKYLRINQFIFSEGASFSNSKFDKQLWAEQTVFCGSAWFGLCQFLQDVDFLKVEFYQNADFPSCEFLGASSFSNTTVGSGLTFRRSLFRGAADFAGMTIKGQVAYENSKFESGANFSYAKFGNGVRFTSVQFCNRVLFRKTEFLFFENPSPIWFNLCQFERPANFDGARFLGCYPEFSGTILHDKTTFTDHTDNWPKALQSDPGQAKASCAAIRHNLEKQGLPEAEHFFFRREMGFAAQIGDVKDWLPYWLFGLFSDYGYSISRPFYWLFGFWVFGVNAFWGYFWLAQQARPFGTAIALSFSNMFQVFGFSRLYFEADFMKCLPLVLQLYAGLQTVVALPLLFFLGLGLRTRFRMR